MEDLPAPVCPTRAKSLSGLYDQIEVRQDRFLIRIAEIKILELDLALEPRHILFFSLQNIRVGIDQREDPFGGGQSRLDLCPERSEIQNGEEELVEAHNK